MRSIEPGISRFPDVQLHIWGLVLTHHPGMTESGLLRRLLLAIDGSYGTRKWQKQRKRLELLRVNACAAASASRSTRRRAGPGTIIRSAAGGRTARRMRPMSEAGASVFASPKVRARSRASKTK